MTDVVLDASAFAPFILEDERSSALPGLYEMLVGDGVVVPVHWRLEVANLLRTAVLRERLVESELAAAIGTIDASIVATDPTTGDHVFEDIWPLAEQHGLTIYDAAYLELAVRRNGMLATHDRALMKAAEAVSVPLFGR